MILANPYITGAPIDSISCHLRAVGYKFASARRLRYLPDARSSPDACRAWLARDAESAGVPNAGTRGRPETVPTVRATSGSPPEFDAGFQLHAFPSQRFSSCLILYTLYTLFIQCLLCNVYTCVGGTEASWCE